MNIINAHIPYLNTYDSNNPKLEILQLKDSVPTSLLAIQQTNLITQDFWYCMLTTENGLKKFGLKSLTGEQIFNRLIEKDLTIVFDCSFEPFLKIINSIYEEVIIKLKVPSSQVIFITNMYDASTYNKEVASRLNQAPIRILWFSALEFMINHYARTLPNIDTLAVKEYNKKFLNLNRRWRSHRPLLTLLLRYRKLLDKGFVSFGPAGESFNSWESIWDGLHASAIGNDEIVNAIRQSEDIKTMPPLYLDTDDLSINRPELTDSTNKYYEDSYFSVVSETTFYYKNKNENSRFITEKTFKAISMNHPFILVSLPKSLDVLKQLGYKTFSPWINESYDLEYDDNKRMLMIVDEIERLSNLSMTDLEHFLVAIKDICSYNYNVLQKKKKFIHQS